MRLAAPAARSSHLIWFELSSVSCDRFGLHSYAAAAAAALPGKQRVWLRQALEPTGRAGENREKLVGERIKSTGDLSLSLPLSLSSLRWTSPKGSDLDLNSRSPSPQPPSYAV